MSLPRPLARLLITLAVLRESLRRRHEPIEDVEFCLHVGAPREVDMERVRR